LGVGGKGGGRGSVHFVVSTLPIFHLTYLFASIQLIQIKGHFIHVQRIRRVSISLWLEHLTYVIAFSIQLVSRAARRDLINLLLLDIPETGIYLGGIQLTVDAWTS
jgi:hypothetical protein